MSTSTPTTLSQEAVTFALLASLVVCLAASFVLAEYLALDSLGAYLVLAITSFVTSTYVVPNLTAIWLGRSLSEIMDT